MVMLVFPPKKTVTEFSNRKKGKRNSKNLFSKRYFIAPSRRILRTSLALRRTSACAGGRADVTGDTRGRHANKQPAVAGVPKVFLRVAFQSVGCMSVFGAAQCTSHGDSNATFAFAPVIRSGLPHRLHAEPAHSFCA
ncbi:hypothetical protein EVAR_76029_1 [Eumeta japonica]|uniref:Uncharacterized protein n=1 Tax=Eumeta variegata TaxID=151549 RepID=A0A4C1UBK7_EUMVA|nr:hypothetical protein EVAR_76029_1 [Eumeta japonica]